MEGRQTGEAGVEVIRVTLAHIHTAPRGKKTKAETSGAEHYRPSRHSFPMLSQIQRPKPHTHTHTHTHGEKDRH